MKITNDRTAFSGIIGETIDIYQVERVVAAAFSQLGGRAVSHGMRQKVIVGHDTSPAADMMESAVCAVLCASGADVLTIGEVPSAAVSHLTSCCDALMGVMITGGSMNHEISGLKFYHSSGRQVTGDLLESIQASIDGRTPLKSKQAGRIKNGASLANEVYLDAVKSSANGVYFEKMTAAVDVMSSSAAKYVSEALTAIGVEVKLLPHDESADSGDVSSYINRAALVDFVRDNQCDIGFAFSADGEVSFAADGDGKVYEPEKLAAICTGVMLKPPVPGEDEALVLVSDTCHTALPGYLGSLGADCRVISGDMTHLLCESENKRTLLAVEKNSGIVFPKYFYVPDGILTAMQVFKCMFNSEKTISALAESMPRFARANCSVVIPTNAEMPNLGTTELPNRINQLRTQLSGDGRISISRDTQNRKIKILVEGIQQNQVTSVAEQLERLVRKSLVEKDKPRSAQGGDNSKK